MSSRGYSRWAMRTLKQFSQNEYVQHRLLAGELDRSIDPQYKKGLEAYRKENPTEVSASKIYLAAKRKEAEEWRAQFRRK